ncbi:polymerase, partial [Globisporangium polare]
MPPAAIAVSSGDSATAAPLSWKDAVKNGVALPQKPLAPRASPHKRDQRDHRGAKRDQKPRQTTCQRAKLLRSRSVSRIVDSPTFRKRNGSVQSQQSGINMNAEKRSSDGLNNKKQNVKSAANHDVKVGAVSTSTSESAKKGVEAPKSPAAKPAVNSLFASPRKAAARREKDDEGAPRTRERSGSADLVLLRRSGLPMWLFSDSKKVCHADLSESKGASVHFAT